MAIATPCQTPGANYTTAISKYAVSLKIDLPPKHNLGALSAEEAQTLEDNIHNALELVLAPYFREQT